MTELEEQLRSLQTPSRPLAQAPLEPAPSLAEAREQRRARRTFAAALVALVAAAAGVLVWANGTRPQAVSTGPAGTQVAAPIGPVETVILTPTGSASPDQLDRAAVILTARLKAFGVVGATVERRDGTIAAIVPAGLGADRVALLAAPGRVELKPVLDEGFSATAGPSGTGVPLSPVVQAEGGTSVVDDGQSRDVLGPAAMSGGFDQATAERFTYDRSRWVIHPILELGANGIDRFNAVAAACFRHESSCPRGQVAFIVDDRLLTAPTINADHFDRDQIEMVLPFTEEQAKVLAALIGSEELPVPLHVS